MNKEKRIGRKLLCLIVSFVMVCTLVPHVPGGLAYAEDNTQAEVVDQTTAPATEEAAPAETESVETAPTETAPAETAPEVAEPAEEQPLPLEAESEHFKATVTYGPEAGIPEGTTLVLTEFAEGSDDFEAAKEALVADEEGNSIYSQTSEEEQENMGMAAFDLTIYDADGNVVEPTEEVAVNIEVLTLPDGADAETLASTMEIQHLNESTGDVVVEKVATVNSDEAAEVESVSEIAVDTEQETAVAEFTVDGFSTYTITYYYNYYTKNVHYVDTNGNSLTPTMTPDFNARHQFLIYDIEGYEYDSTHIGSRTGTSIQPILRSSSSSGLYYSEDVQYISGSNWRDLNNDDIYVVYKAKPTPSQGGTPQVDQDEEWPEGNNAPQFSKSSTNNGNGTNTISLSIVGGEKPVEKSTPADVIVVFDVSGSMSESMNGQTRLARAKTAVNNMAYALLNGDNKGVRMALISFSTDAQTVPATGEVFTSDYNTFSGRVNNLGASGGTNWEKALKIANEMPVRDNAATFVVFVTDGDPTFRVSRGDVSDRNLDNYSDGTYQYYRNNYVFGEGNDDSEGRNFNFAVEQVKGIDSKNKEFYAIGISNSVTKVRNLTTQGGVDASHAFTASDATAMENAFKAITESIKSSLGFGDVQITDGITSLTNAEMKVMQSVDPNSFKYYRYGGEGNKYGADAAHKTEWTTREADGCAAASYNETKGAVEWNMGETFQLEDDVTYVVEFTVWPSQAAYDLVADLNNGIKTYASLTDAEKAQVVEVTAPTETTTGTYALKTNTDKVSATYSQTSKTGETVTVSGDTNITATYHEGDLQNMGLVSDFITIKKEWNNELDGRSASAVKLTVTKDGSDYIKDIELSNDNEWTSGKEYISAGVITTAADGRYNVREKGHEYTVIEPDTTVSYYWNLTADVYRPMVIDGTLHVLIKTDAPTGKEGTDYFVIDDKNYQLKDGQTTLTASNDRRSYLNLKKAVTVAEGKTNPDPDAVFNYTVTIKDPAGADIWFSVMDKDKKTVEPAISENVTAEMDTDGKLTGYYHVPSGAEFTIGIKDGWNARFINLPLDTTYSIKESETAGFGLDNATATATNEGTAGTVNNDTVTGTVDKSNADYTVTYNNKITGAVAELEATKVLSGRDWTDTDSFEFILTPGTNTAGEGVVTPMPAGSAEDGTKTVTVNKDTADKKALFGDILFPYEGTYNYTIKEVKPDPAIPGVVYDEAEHNVVVTVSKSGDNMTATVKYDNDKDSLTVENTLTPVVVNPEVEKKLVDKDGKALALRDSDSFTFKIEAVTDGAPMPSSDTATANNTSNWKAVFGNISYNKVGIYNYTITEQQGTIDGVTYNTTPVNVTVTIGTDPNTNELTKTVTYNDEASASVQNTFTPVTAAPQVTKSINDWGTADHFTFKLTAGTNDAGVTTPMPASDTATATKTNTTAVFGDITFEKAGEYNYTITEVDEGVDGVTYDTSNKNVVITVTRNPQTNALSAAISYNGASALTVSNSFASASAELQATKSVVDKDGKAVTDWGDADKFEFTLAAGSNNAGVDTPMPAKTTAEATKANPQATFDSITYKKAGVYNYTITETAGNVGGMKYDTTSHNVVVTVEKAAGSNTIEVTSIKYDSKDSLTIENTLTPVTAEPKATKEINEWGTAKNFTFVLEGENAATPMPVDAVTADGKTTKSVTVKKGESLEAAFGAISFNKEGTYNYTITEVNDGVDGVTYDATSHKVVIKVEKDKADSSKLVAAVTYDGKDSLTITNTFTAAETKDEIKATKKLEGRDWKDTDSFTFTLAAQDNAPMPEGSSNGQKTVTVTDATADHTALFGKIKYEKAGTYNYTITESQGSIDGVAYDTKPYPVVVEVTKDEKTNALTATVKYNEEDSLTITNTYKKADPITLEVTKAINDWGKAKEFEFTLTADGDAPMPASATAKATENSKTAVFGSIEYETAGTYKYTITEKNGGVDGVSYDTTPKSVIVTVVKDPTTNALSASVKYDGNDSLTVTNTYTAAETSAPIQVTKSFNDWSKADKFTFTLAAKNNATMPEGVEGSTMTADATAENPVAVFGKIKYEKTGTYEYTITETKGNADGVTYDTKAYDVKVVVTKKDDATNAMSATVTYDKDKTALVVQNTFKPSQGIVLQATKSFTGTTWTDDYTFDFVLESVENAPMPEGAKDGKMTVTATKDAPTAVFGSVTYNKAGEYKYTITEKNGGKDGVAYDTVTHNVVVTVAKDDNNQLTATAAYDGGSSLTINNTYSKTEPVNLTATKAFNDWGKATQFTFNLEAVNGAPMPEGTTAGVKAATATKDAAAVFGAIQYEKAGTYKYTITEVNDGIDGVSYDTTPHEVVVTVTKANDATNKLTATVKYDDKTALEIKNTYTSVTTAEPIEVTKAFNDWGKAKSFTFDIAAVTKDAPMPEKTSATATEAAKTAQFGTITFEKAGRYEYTITERNGGADGVSYDTKAHKVVVNVTKATDATNKLTATVTYDGQSSLTITNKYEAAKTTKPIEVTKAFNDWGKADSFTFNLAAVTEGAPMPKDADGKDVTVATATKDAPLAVFGDITFEKAGTYQYTITERNDGKDGVSYDVTSHTVTVDVKKADDATNKLTATVKYDSTKDDLTVTNTYKSVETSEAIKATKSFNDWGKAESFTFNLAAVTEGAPMPKDAQGKDVTTAVATKDNVEAVFGKITYEKAGTYEYTITEVDDGVDGVTYDTTPKTVTVTVTKADDATNALSATVKYGKDDALTVVNSFESGKATLQATKSFNDWTKAKSFTFDLAAVTKDAPMPALTEATATQQRPTAVFGEVAYTKAGTYEYTITERNGGADGVSYDTKAHKVVVTVTKGAGNKLSTDVKYDGAASLTITNEYKSVETKDSIKATKDFNDWGKADSFTFNLAAVTVGAPMPAKTQAVATKDAPVANFGKITYEKAGIYEYTITEVNDGKDGVSYDTAPHKVVVTVTKADDATNALTATVKYDSTKDDLTVTNTYKSVETSEAIKATKDFNDWGKADSFTFNLAAVTVGAPMPKDAQGKDVTTAVATKDKVEAVFGKITFEKAGTYEYTITEQNGKADGVNYDTTAHKLTIVVEKAADATNALTVASVKYDGGDKLTVKNEYSSLEMPTESLLRVTKEIKGREWLADDKFEFTLAPVDGAPMPKNAKATADTKNKTAIFDAMTFEKTGTYKYTITETDGKKGGLTYDTKSYEVTVVIGKANDATNALKVDSVTYEGKDSLTVTNKYNAEGTAEFDAQKILKGRGLAEGEFTFELKKDGVKVGEAKNDAKGKVIFTGVKFVKDENGKDETGKYTFTISEVVPEEADKLGGVTYDDTVARIAVEVTDNGDGTLAVTYDGKDKATTPEFTNIYEAEGELVLKGLKTLEFGDLADQAFNFTVLDAEGNEVATAVAGGEGAAVTGDADTKEGTKSEFNFSAIKYSIKADKSGEMIDQTGDYTYIVKEVIPDEAVNTKTGKTYKEDPAADGIFELGSYRYDNSEKTVKIKVSDNGDGTLKVEQTEGDKVQSFTNTKAYTDIEITKELKDYVEHAGVKEATLAFRVVDKETKGQKFSAAGGITFTEDEVKAGTPKTVKISKIPTDIPVVVTEVYAGNFRPDYQTVELKLVDGVYKASFTNTYDNVDYNSGVINSYKKGTDGYEYVDPNKNAGN